MTIQLGQPEHPATRRWTSRLQPLTGVDRTDKAVSKPSWQICKTVYSCKMRHLPPSLI